MENLDSAPDTTFLQVAADPDRHRVLRRLVRGPATQKELAAELDLNSGTLSKQMAKLTSARLVRRQRPHAPYELLFRDGVARLLQANINLKLEVDKASVSAGEQEQRELNEAVMRPASAPTETEIA